MNNSTIENKEIVKIMVCDLIENQMCDKCGENF